MDRTSTAATLQIDEDNRTHNGNKVERQVNKIANHSLGAKLRKRALEDLAQLGHGVTAALELSALAHDGGSITRHQSGIKSVQDGILEQPSTGNTSDDGCALTQDEENGRHYGQGTVEDEQEAQLGNVGECEHAGDDADGQGQEGTELRKEGLP